MKIPFEGQVHRERYHRAAAPVLSSWCSRSDAKQSCWSHRALSAKRNLFTVKQSTGEGQKRRQVLTAECACPYQHLSTILYRSIPSLLIEQLWQDLVPYFSSLANYSVVRFFFLCSEVCKSSSKVHVLSSQCLWSRRFPSNLDDSTGPQTLDTMVGSSVLYFHVAHLQFLLQCIGAIQPEWISKTALNKYIAAVNFNIMIIDDRSIANTILKSWKSSL